ncbi:Na+/H+ antiporter NhaC family protein [Peptoniphilaceae bacterium SGI.131]
MSASIWSLIPPIVAIGVSLKTKEVNISLVLGILIGALIYTGFNPVESLVTFFNVLKDSLGPRLIIIFFVAMLGIIVYLMNSTGATKAYASWASKKLKNEKQTLIASVFLGTIIFIDDYFNTLTVGTVMKPLVDKHRVSREKFAYIIDSTTAPVCMVAPISTWAAGVIATIPQDSGIDGFSLFIKSIPGNYYALFTIFLVFLSVIFSINIGPMARFDKLAKEGKADYPKEYDYGANEGKGGVIDLLLPVLAIVVFSILSILYLGGLFKGAGILEAFDNSDPVMGLALGSSFTLILQIILYLPRKIISPKKFTESIVEGIKTMLPAILILTFAWALGEISGAKYLNAGQYISKIISDNDINLQVLPAVIFVISILLSFSTGTSWGTFAILIPIVVAIFKDAGSDLMVLTVSAVLGGSVCGDHLSPISDTTILSSIGAGCHHINHVSSQMPYGIMAAVVAFLSYLSASYLQNTVIGLICGLVLLTISAFILKSYYDKRLRA